MLVAAIVDRIDGGPDAGALLFCGVPTTAIGVVVWRSTTAPKDVRNLEVYVTVTLAWVSLACVGALPYLATGRLTSVEHALFESISGFTTTGATVLRPVADTSQGLLLYRALSQWIGGMGVIVLVIAVLPTVGSGAMNLMTAEAPGPSGERLSPRVRQTARNLWTIYLGFTVAVVAAYVAAGMSLFDGLAHAFTTVSTGGFSPHNASLAHFDSAAVEWIAIAAMFLAVASYAHRSALSQLHPRLVRPVRVGSRALPEEIATRIVGFMVLALVVFGGGAVLIALTGPDMITSFSAAASSFGNVGPGLGDVGPTGDYLALPWVARVVTMVQMLLGRLEIYPVMLALSVFTLRRRLHPARD